MKACPTCGRTIETVMDYPIVRVVAANAYPMPANAYTTHAVNGPAELEPKRAVQLWLEKVEAHENDSGVTWDGDKPTPGRIYLLDRYTGVAGAGVAFKRFLEQEEKPMRYKDLLFEKRYNPLYRAGQFTVQRDVLPWARNLYPRERLDAYLARLRRAVGKQVRAETLSPSWGLKKNGGGGGRFAQGGIGLDLWPSQDPPVKGSSRVDVTVTFSEGGTLGLVVGLFKIATIVLRGKLMGGRANMRPKRPNQPLRPRPDAES